jgi:hypothetical protein
MDISISPTNIYFIGSTNFHTEDVPYDKFQEILDEECSSFFDDDILPNRNLYQNFKHLLGELRDITLNVTYRRIEKSLTEKAVNLIKDKIKSLGSDILKIFKR